MGNPTEEDVYGGSNENGNDNGIEKDVGKETPVYERRASITSQRKGSVTETLGHDLFDERYERTQRGLKSRHAQMIALGGTIGTGLFVGSGQTLARGGPAFILSAYIFMSFLIFCVVTGITEVAAYLPTPGSSMNLFGYRYVSRSMGFSLGWLYFYSLGILVPYEITAAGLVIDYWNPPVNIAVWVTIMLVVIVGLNTLPVRFYGETEFWFAGTKIIMMIGLLLVSIVIFFGGGPSHDRLGFRYWNHPGAANTYLASGNTGRFLALLSTVVLSAFPFTFAPELMVVTGGEMKNPRRNLPTAARRYIYRLLFFYIFSVLAIGVICPSNDPAITDGGAGAGSSAFVIGIRNAGINVLPSIINAGIIISAWSSGNSFLYLSSRSLYSLALSGNAPSFFKACTKSGVPYRAVACSSLFTALAYLNCGTSGAIVFNWFVNLTNTSGFISWICCGIILLRFRKAVNAQGVTDLPYRSWMQPWGSWCSIVGFTFLCLINGFNVFWPQNWSASSFLTAYIGIPIFLVIYFGHRIYTWSDPWAHDPTVVDLQTGMAEVLAEEKPPKPKDPNQKIWGFIKGIWE
ncbi:histidine permease [Rhizodiscina lignyota]|uniref:Histidine permease n=1 Tax=Rhizodiscina lignyota TaxID=1504668 RepID=A0A9P4IAX3_9PEZI|nr:histidine permease [Rhizodiscina lignyota]